MYISLFLLILSCLSLLSQTTIKYLLLLYLALLSLSQKVSLIMCLAPKIFHPPYLVSDASCSWLDLCIRDHGFILFVTFSDYGFGFCVHGQIK